MAPFLGCIADDLTGATDLALMLTRNGMRTVQVIGVPDAEEAAPDAEAVVVALKSRTLPAEMAVDQSLAALSWLQSVGAQRFFFKYCSTFDSTDDGNIGPVGDALADRLSIKHTIACPSFPTNERSVYQGHLFIGDQLLSDSSMRHHPLTPMTDANLVRVLGRQTHRNVGLIGYDIVARGRSAIANAMAGSAGWSVVDALQDAHLVEIGEAAVELTLITGGSGLALGLPSAYADRGLAPLRGGVAFVPPKGPSAMISGSCSAATQEQVARASRNFPSYKLDPLAVAADPRAAVTNALDWAGKQPTSTPILVYSTAAPQAVNDAQERLGRAKAGSLIEDALACIGSELVNQGARRLIVAGGETSGAVVDALGVGALNIGPEITPGVPWTVSTGDRPLALALKSGNFGGPDFFAEALNQLDGNAT